MKLNLLTLAFFMGTLVQAQDMSTAENQCRADAKEIAIKSYQSCITEARTARLENIRKEYQEKLADLKKQYDAQLQELKTQKNPEKNTEKNTEPTVTLKKATSAKAEKKTTKTDKKVTLAKAKKPVSNIITEAELEKSAPATAHSDSAALSNTVETNTTTGETENLQMVDPTLPAEQ